MYLFVLLCVYAAYAQDTASVNTTQGVVVGHRVNDKYLAFYGIPYAGPTSGENRFKAPRPAPNFPGEFHAVQTDVLCAQPSPRGIIGVEDCLILNIYTQNLSTPKPVIVWINGENFATDIKPYSFDTLILSDLVVVSINYRLSIFGFLCLAVSDAPGNGGLKDVVQGLRWIQANIEGFGGDPQNVILMGHGSGAAMVDLITLSPLASGLIHKAIVLSGSGLAPWAISYDPVNRASVVGDKLGYAGKNREELARLLASTDFNVLGNVLDSTWSPNNTVMFTPCIENANLDPKNTFLANTPMEILQSGNYSDIPYIGGYTSREGTIKAEYVLFNQWLEKMEANFTDFIQVDICFPEGNRSALVEEIRNYYFSQKKVNMQTIEDYLNYHGNTTIVVPMIRNVRKRASTSKSEVRLFEFSFQGTDNSDWPFQQIPLTGVRHGRILNYLFDVGLTESDTMAKNNLLARFTAFAYTGSPNISDSGYASWLPIEKSVEYSLLIFGDADPKLTVYREQLGVFPNKEAMEFWSTMYYRFYVPPTLVSSASKLSTMFIFFVLSQLIIGSI